MHLRIFKVLGGVTMSRKSRMRKARKLGSPEMQAYRAERADIVRQADAELVEVNRRLAGLRFQAENGGDRERIVPAVRKALEHSEMVKAREKRYLEGLRQRYAYLFEGVLGR